MRPVIGIFDSGIGGLSVLAACAARLPSFRYLYLGDNRRAPYGSRPPEEILAFTEEALVRLRKRGADGAVLACNTATAVCLHEMRKRFSFPILGIEPAVLPAARGSRGRVLVLCTPRTAASERLAQLLARCPETDFTVHACPRLAAAVEDRFLRGRALSLREHLPGGTFGGVVLGCTHYALIAREISAFYSAPVYDGAEGVARRLEALFPAPAVERRWSENTKRNKSLRQNGRDSGGANVCFLGKCAKENRAVFKQTFYFGVSCGEKADPREKSGDFWKKSGGKWL